jgi:hypothetical protein
VTGPSVTLELLAELLEETRAELVALRTLLERTPTLQLVTGCSLGPTFARSDSNAALSTRSSSLSRSCVFPATHDR